VSLLRVTLQSLAANGNVATWSAARPGVGD
jgi:hypothetical protein